MICLSRRAKHAEYLLSLERQVTTGQMRQIDEKNAELKALRLQLENSERVMDSLRELLKKAKAERDEARSQRDESALHAQAQEGAAKSWKECAQREQGKAESAGVVLRDTEEKLRKAELALDLSRDRREEIGKQLDELREVANDAMNFLYQNSGEESEAFQVACDIADALNN